MRILFLDDNGDRHDEFDKQYPDDDIVHVYTYTECCTALATLENFDIAWLDHDLGDFHEPDVHDNEYTCTKIEYTGLDVALYICNVLEVIKCPAEIMIHSWNPSGSRYMKSEFDKAGIRAICQPFTAACGQAPKFVLK
jgi:hypothetical protein